MANDDKTRAGADATSQAQAGSAEKAHREANTPEKNADEIQHFDTTITKMVDREVEDDDGNTHTETLEVLSDNLYPGEKLKRASDEEENERTEEAAHEERAKATKAAKAEKNDKR